MNFVAPKPGVVSAQTEKALPLRNPKQRSRFQPRVDLFKGEFSEQALEKRPISATINRPIADVYAKLRNIENLPMFLEHLTKVDAVSPTQTKWYFGGEAPFDVAMNIASETPNQMLIWKSEDAAGFEYKMAVALEEAQAGRGTIARMVVTYDTKAGAFAGAFEKLFGQDAELVGKKTMQRFKCFCETGHVPTTEGQPSGRSEDLDENQTTELKH